MNIIDEKVDALKEVIDGVEVDMLERMKFRLSDAMREGAAVSGQARDWSDEQGNLCALSTAVVSARARGYLS